VGVQKKI